MNKLKELEQKYKELGAEIERLKRAKTGKVLRVSDLVEGDEYCQVRANFCVFSVSFDNDGNDKIAIKSGVSFYDKQSATNHRDARILAHECDIAIAESWDGEEIDYNDQSQRKYYLTSGCDYLIVEWLLSHHHRFAFKTPEHAHAFIDKHGEEAVINMLRNY